MSYSTTRFLTLLAILIIVAGCKNPVKNKQALTENPAYQSDPSIRKLTERIEINPQDASLYFDRGNMLRHMRQDTLALLDYKMATKLDSSKAAYYSAVGDLLFENKDLAGSVVWIQKAIDKDPEDRKARLKIAKLFLYIRKYPEAFEQINIVLRKDAYNAEGYFLKGMIYKDLKDTAKAISSFQTAISTAPEYRDALLTVGLLYCDKKNPIGLKYIDRNSVV